MKKYQVIDTAGSALTFAMSLKDARIARAKIYEENPNIGYLFLRDISK